MNRLEKLARIRNRQRSVAVAHWSACQQREREIEAEIAAMSQSVDALTGGTFSLLHFETLARTLEHAHRSLAETRVEGERRRALVDLAAAASGRADKLCDRSRQDEATETTHREQRAQDERHRGRPW